MEVVIGVYLTIAKFYKQIAIAICRDLQNYNYLCIHNNNSSPRRIENLARL